MENIVRKYIPKNDADQVYDLFIKIFSYSKLNLDPKTDFDTLFKGFIIEKDNEKEEKEIVAFLMYTEPDAYLEKDYILHYIEYIGVDPKYTCKGYGQKLLDTFLKEIDKLHVTLYLHVEDNTVFTNFLIKWYGKNGFILGNKSTKENVYEMIRDKR